MMEEFKSKKEDLKNDSVSREQMKNLQENIGETKKALNDYLDDPDRFEAFADEESQKFDQASKKVFGGILAFIGSGALIATVGGGYQEAMKLAQENAAFFHSSTEVPTTQALLALMTLLAAFETAIGVKWLFEKKGNTIETV